MDTVSLRALVIGFPEDIDHVVPDIAAGTSDSEEAQVIKTISWTETLWKRWGLDFRMKLPTYPKRGNQALRSSG